MCRFLPGGDQVFDRLLSGQVTDLWNSWMDQQVGVAERLFVVLRIEPQVCREHR